METNPICYGLSARVQLEIIGVNHLALRKVIKSRIIQKDAVKILEMVRKIKNVNPKLEITLICTSNICSKSKKILKNEDIGLIMVD